MNQLKYSVCIAVEIYVLVVARILFFVVFFFSSRRRHTRWTGDWSSDVCSSDLMDRQFAKLRKEVPHVKRLPSEYMRTNVWFTTQPVEEPEPRQHLADVIEWLGWRSEERRVGKECRTRGAACQEEKKDSTVVTA